MGAARTCPGTDADSQCGEIVERFDCKALHRGELKRRIVHREYDTHRAMPGSLRPIGPVPVDPARRCGPNGDGTGPIRRLARADPLQTGTETKRAPRPSTTHR